MIHPGAASSVKPTQGRIPAGGEKTGKFPLFLFVHQQGFGSSFFSFAKNFIIPISPAPSIHCPVATDRIYPQGSRAD